MSELPTKAQLKLAAALVRNCMTIQHTRADMDALLALAAKLEALAEAPADTDATHLPSKSQLKRVAVQRGTVYVDPSLMDALPAAEQRQLDPNVLDGDDPMARLAAVMDELGITEQRREDFADGFMAGYTCTIKRHAHPPAAEPKQATPNLGVGSSSVSNSAAEREGK